MLGDRGARRVDRLPHFLEDVQATVLRLGECGGHDGAIHTLDLDVHLQAGDALAGADHLEIHVAEVVLVAEDVGEHHHLVTLLDQAHGHAGDRRLDGHTGVHQGQAGAADRGHGGGAVGLEHLGDHPQGVGEGVIGGQYRLDAAAGQGAVADVAATGTAQPPDLADAEGREVVVEHEAAIDIAAQPFQVLLVALAAQGADDQGLGLAPGEQGRTVRPRQDTDFAGDGPDFFEGAAVEAYALVDDAVAHHLFLVVAEQSGHPRGVVADLRVDGRDHLGLEQVVAVGPGHLVRGGHYLSHAGGSGLLDQPAQVFVHHRRRHLTLGPADLALQVELQIDERLDGGMGEEDRLEHHVLAQFTDLALDHDHGVAGTGDHQVESGLLELTLARIEHVLAVDVADPGRGNGAGERDVGDHQRGGGAVHGQDVRIELLVGGEDGGDQLGLAGVAVRKERPQRPVDQPAGEHLFLARPADLAPEIAAGDAAGGIHPLLIFDGQRQEAQVLGPLLGHHRDQHLDVAAGHDHGAVGLFGHLAGFKGNGTATEFGCDCLDHAFSCSGPAGICCGGGDASAAANSVTKAQRRRRQARAVVTASFVSL